MNSLVKLVLSSMLLIKEIESEKTIQIRSEILRPGQDLSTCIYPKDDDSNSFHLAAFIDSKIISIVSFYEEKNANLDGDIQYRFRGMATLNDYRNKGYAGALLKFAFAKINGMNGSLVWCNARLKAVKLYKSMGMEICSSEFIIPSIGPHYVMKIEL